MSDQPIFQIHQPPQVPIMETLEYYFMAIYRKKWLVILLFLVTTALAFFAIQKTGVLEPEEKLSVHLGMHQPLEKEQVSEYYAAHQQKIALLTSRSFLTDIVMQKSLLLQLKEHPRNRIFDSIKVQEFSIKGRYRFLVDKAQNSYTITLSNINLGYKDKIIRSGRLSQLSSFAMPGLYLNFNSFFLEQPFPFEFSLISTQQAIARFRKSFTVSSPAVAAARPAYFNPSFHISLKGKHDVPLMASTVNYVADHFIEKDMLLRKERTNQTVALLQTQLQAADRQRISSLQDLNRYLSLNPDAALNEKLALTMTHLDSLESKRPWKKSAQNEARQLLNNYKKSDKKDRLRTAGEILSFLQNQQVSTASYLSGAYDDLMDDQEKMERSVAQNHPFKLENQKKLDKMEQKAVQMLGSYIGTLNQELDVEQRQIWGLNRTLNSLPNKYTKLAELERTHQTHSETYSAILSKFNEAKLATSVEVADFYVIDYAVEPLPKSMLRFYLKLLAICYAIGFFFSIGPILLFETFKNTASTSYEMRKFRKLKLLDSLPIVRSFNEKDKKQGSMYQQIAVPDGTHSAASFQESIRSLSEKLMMKLQQKDKSFVIISFEPNTGKSTFAANLAATMAKRKFKTLLIDGDLQQGRQAEIFSIDKKPGLSNVLKDSAPLSYQLLRENIIASKIENLHVLPCGNYEANSYELISQPRMRELKTLVSSHHQVVILDTPPIGACADAIAVANYFSCFIPITLAGKTNLSLLNKKLEEFPAIQEKSTGIILNKVPFLGDYGYYYYYSNRKAPLNKPIDEKAPPIKRQKEEIKTVQLGQNNTPPLQPSNPVNEDTPVNPESRMLAREKDILAQQQSLVDKIEKSNRHLAELEQSKKKIEKQIKSANIELTSVQKELQQKSREEEKTTTQLAQIKEADAKLRKLLTEVKQQEKKVEADTREWERKRQEEDHQLAELKRQRKSEEEKLQAVKDNLNHIQKAKAPLDEQKGPSGKITSQKETEIKQLGPENPADSKTAGGENNRGQSSEFFSTAAAGAADKKPTAEEDTGQKSDSAKSAQSNKGKNFNSLLIR